MKNMKPIWNSFKIAFSMYSKIPMGKSDWTKENMRYVLCFFPMVGVAIGAIMYLVLMYGTMYLQGKNFGLFFLTTIAVAIPVWVTGGIHLDGLLDTADALSSYQEKDKRLEILKDPRAGAFAIITCVVYFLIYLGIYHLAVEVCVGKKEGCYEMLLILCLGFILARAYSGLSIVTFQMAKNTGLAATFSDMAQKKIVRNCMLIYIVGISIGMMMVHIIIGSVAIITSFFVFLYYKKMSLQMFGGITGDLCGWFLQICELIVTVAVVVTTVVMMS